MLVKARRGARSSRKFERYSNILMRRKSARTVVPERQEMEEKSCFVIGPIGDKLGNPGSENRETWEQAIEIFEEVILPACSAFGLRPLRADQISQPGEIPEQVYKHLRDDDVVIADVTGANANVMYELGLRHTVPKLTIQIGEAERLPFDVAAIRTILFKRTAAGLIEARKKLSASLSTGLELGGLAVGATRVWLEKLECAPLAILSPLLPEILEDEPGYLEKIADMTTAVAKLPQQLKDLAGIMQDIGTLVNKATEQMDRINTSNGPPGAKVEIANRLAEDLQVVSSQLDTNVNEFRFSVEQADPGVRFILKAPSGVEPPEESKILREAVTVASQAIAQTLQNAQFFRERMLESGDATRLLRKANTRLAAALGDYMEAAEKISGWQDLE
jgi:uncharacterized protein YoxC